MFVVPAPTTQPLTETTPKSPPTDITAKPTGETKPAEGQSILNEEDPHVVPETYEEFKVPEGYTLDKAAIEKASPLFKELNLTQDQAQKLVDFYATEQKAAIDKPYQDYQAIRKAEVDKVKAEYGTRLPEVRATIGRALNSLGLPTDVVKGFRDTMDNTGAGDFLPFVKVFEAMARKISEGRPVMGRGPAPVANPNAKPATAAQALFPNLPSSAPQ